VHQHGISCDNLVGLNSAPEAVVQPPRRTATYVMPSTSSRMPAPPSRPGSAIPIPPNASANGVPIPRPSSRIHRPTQTPLSHQPTSASFSSPSPDLSPIISPLTHTVASGGLSYNSATTELTTPNSDASLHSAPPTPPTAAPSVGRRILSYPAVPPPSLSSSLGSPSIPFHMPLWDSGPSSPIDIRGNNREPPGHGPRRPSGSMSRSHSRGRGSHDRGARVVETGSLLSRRAIPTAAGASRD
jgi:hypothetical protein